VYFVTRSAVSHATSSVLNCYIVIAPWIWSELGVWGLGERLVGLDRRRVSAQHEEEASRRSLVVRRRVGLTEPARIRLGSERG
jgi:hypothetical protein